MNGAFFSRSAPVEQVQNSFWVTNYLFQTIIERNLKFFLCCCNAFYFSIRVFNNSSGFSLAATSAA